MSSDDVKPGLIMWKDLTVPNTEENRDFYQDYARQGSRDRSE
jgi:hypothetical protein